MNSYTVSVTIKPGAGLYAVSFVRHHKSRAVQKDAAAIPRPKKRAYSVMTILVRYLLYLQHL